jgi:hypothetical protein
VNHVSFSPNGQIMATCGEDMTIFLFQTPAGQPAKTRGGAGGKEEVGFEPIGWIELDFIPLALSWKSDSTRFLLAGAVESVVEVRVGGRGEEGTHVMCLYSVCVWSLVFFNVFIQCVYSPWCSVYMARLILSALSLRDGKFHSRSYLPSYRLTDET